MIVRENDPPARKWKFYFLELFLSLLVHAVCLGIPILIFLKSDRRILGAVLFFLMFYVGEKINCAIENHIGIGLSNWNPNRAYLVQLPPAVTPPWLKPKNPPPPDPGASPPRGNGKKRKKIAKRRLR